MSPHLVQDNHLFHVHSKLAQAKGALQSQGRPQLVVIHKMQIGLYNPSRRGGLLLDLFLFDELFLSRLQLFRPVQRRRHRRRRRTALLRLVDEHHANLLPIHLFLLFFFFFFFFHFFFNDDLPALVRANFAP